MTVSRRSFFGLAAGAAAAAAGVAQAAPEYETETFRSYFGQAKWVPAKISDPRHTHMTAYFGDLAHSHFNPLADPTHAHTFTTAADLPPFPPIRSIDIHMTRDKTPAPKLRPISQKQFEHRLSSPIGKGRLE